MKMGYQAVPWWTWSTEKQAAFFARLACGKRVRRKMLKAADPDVAPMPPALLGELRGVLARLRMAAPAPSVVKDRASAAKKGWKTRRASGAARRRKPVKEVRRLELERQRLLKKYEGITLTMAELRAGHSARPALVETR